MTNRDPQSQDADLPGSSGSASEVEGADEGTVTSSQNASVATEERRREIVQHKRFSGPLPPPDLLEHYQQIQPDLVERIVALTERESQHRHRIESKLIEREAAEAWRGQVFGLTLALVAFAVATFALYKGYPTPAGIIGGTTVVGLVGVFVIGRWPREKDGNSYGGESGEDE